MGRPPFTADQLHASLVRRYHENVIKNEDGCWGWGRGENRKFPYPTLMSGHSDSVCMHRFSYEIHVGPIPQGMWVLHHCDNHRCTRPDHLYLGDHKQNQRDVRDRGTKLTAVCRRGHARTASNTYVRVDRRGYTERHCRECDATTLTARLLRQRQAS